MDLAPPPLPSRQNRSPSFDAPRPDFGSAPPPLPQRPYESHGYNQPQYNNYNQPANNFNQNPPPIPYHNNNMAPMQYPNNNMPVPYNNTTPQYSNNMPPHIPYQNQPPINAYPTAMPQQQNFPPNYPPQPMMHSQPIINAPINTQPMVHNYPAPMQQPIPTNYPTNGVSPVAYTNNANVNNHEGAAPYIAPRPGGPNGLIPMNVPPKNGLPLPMPKKGAVKLPFQPQASTENGARPLPGLAPQQPMPQQRLNEPIRVSPRASVPLPGMVNSAPQQGSPGTLPSDNSAPAPPRPVKQDQISPVVEAPTTTTIIMPAQPKIPHRQSIAHEPKGGSMGGPPKGAVKKQPLFAGPPKTNQQLGPPPVTRPRSTSTGDASSVPVIPAINIDAVASDTSAPPLPVRPNSDHRRTTSFSPEDATPYKSSDPVPISPYTYVAVPQKDNTTTVELVESTYGKGTDIPVPRKASTGEKPHSPTGHKIHSIYEVVDEIRTDKVKGGYTAHIVEIEERSDIMDSKKKKVKMYKVSVTKGGVSWAIYRRYDQFFEFDKKLKSKKLLVSDDAHLPSKKMFLNSEEKNQLAIERFSLLNKYLDHVLIFKNIQESDVLWMFIEPTQLGDVKPQK